MYLRRRLSGSVLSLSCPKLAERFAVLLEVSRGEVVHLVLLQKRIHLHPRLEAKEPAKLSSREGVGPICFERQTLERSPGQVLPLGSELLHDVLGQFQCNLHASAFTSLSQGQWLPNYFVRFSQRRDLRNKAYRRTSSGSAASRSAVALRRAVVRDFGLAPGKKAVMGCAPQKRKSSLISLLHQAVFVVQTCVLS